MNTMIPKQGHVILVRVHRVPIAMSPILGVTVGKERATGCIRLLMSGMPTGCSF